MNSSLLLSLNNVRIHGICYQLNGSWPTKKEPYKKLFVKSKLKIIQLNYELKWTIKLKSGVRKLNFIHTAQFVTQK